jgi:hypothetical protein
LLAAALVTIERLACDIAASLDQFGGSIAASNCGARCMKLESNRN